MRTFNRICSLLLAVVLFVVGLLLAAEALMLLLKQPALLVPRDGWYHALTTTAFDETTVLVISIVLLVVGLALLIAQLRPWRPIRLAAKNSGWHLQRRSTQRSLSAAVGRVPGVSPGRTRLGRHWRLTVRAAANEPDRKAVRTAVTRELERLSAADSSRVRLRLSRRRVV